MESTTRGQLIQQYRKQKGFTQLDLADACGIDIRTIQRIEAGDVFPRLSTLKLIAAELGIDLEELNGAIPKHNKLSYSRELILISLIFGFLHLVNWFFHIPLFQKQLISPNYHWITSVINMITDAFMYLGFLLIARHHGGKMLRFASWFFMIGSPLSVFLNFLVAYLAPDASGVLSSLTIAILGINCIFFGVGLLKIKSPFILLFKSAGILQLIIAPFFILPFTSLNIIGCWLNIPFYMLLLITLFKYFMQSKSSNPTAAD